MPCSCRRGLSGASGMSSKLIKCARPSGSFSSMSCAAETTWRCKFGTFARSRISDGGAPRALAWGEMPAQAGHGTGHAYTRWPSRPRIPGATMRSPSSCASGIKRQPISQRAPGQLQNRNVPHTTRNAVRPPPPTPILAATYSRSLPKCFEWPRCDRDG